MYPVPLRLEFKTNIPLLRIRLREQTADATFFLPDWWRKSKLYQKRYNEERVKTDDLEIQLARKYARLHHHEVKDLNKRWKDAMVKIKGLEDANRILRSRVEKKMWGFVKDPKPPVYESSDATEEEA